MSTTTDNKVVEMRFDNQQFEKNANQSISTLDKLKQALKFDRSSTKSLDDLQRSTKNFNLDNMNTGTCPTASVEFDLATKNPAEFFRMVEGLTSPKNEVHKVIDMDALSEKLRHTPLL